MSFEGGRDDDRSLEGVLKFLFIKWNRLNVFSSPHPLLGEKSVFPAARKVRNYKV